MKLLTVDDSRTVRIIVKKAFKEYDLTILEAANGVEGLAVAERELPDLILLDVTMPVMDGIEMLTKLKSNPALKSIPVIMLTAEGGRDTVLKIAKIGVRDYMVKPFEEQLLLEKVGRIVDLKLLGEEAATRRTILEPAHVLVVEDKPAIIEQIRAGLKHTPWTVHDSENTWSAINYTQNNPIDIFLVSLNLANDSAFELFQVLRSNRKTKNLPIIGMVVKTDRARLSRGQQMRFSALVTKPLDLAELETRICRCMNLDLAPRYFAVHSRYLAIRYPMDPTAIDLTEVASALGRMLGEAVDAGLNRVVVDLQPMKVLDVDVIKQLMQINKACRDLSLDCLLIGNPEVNEQGKAFEETKHWRFHESLDSAESMLSAT